MNFENTEETISDSKYAPIIVFVYNRPEHTCRTLTMLAKNYLARESDLFVFCDGPKENATEEQKNKILEVRNIVRKNFGFKSITVTESDKNKGLAPSVIAGVTEIVNKFEKCIVVEDDLDTSPYFLQYMNDALVVYKDIENVACIHGYVEPHKKQLPETFFLKGADCWGWATWKRAWVKFNPDGQELLDEIHRRHCEKHFNFNNTYNYVGMLEDQIAGKNSSWAIRWQASAYLNNMYCLYPNETLILNVGFDGTGTHCGKMNTEQREVVNHKVSITLQKPEECLDAYKAYCIAYKKNKQSLLIRIIKKIIKILKAIINKKGRNGK